MKTILRIISAVLAIAALACLGLFFLKGAGAGKLTWEDPIVRKSIMTFAYKIYGNRAAQNGRYFVSKIVFHNDGTGAVRNLSVSYQIPDYVSWTTPQSYPEVPTGETVVELYYPQFPARVTQLTSQTNATLETKIHWQDEAGKEKEQILRSDLILRGVNEIEYTDLPANELLTWYDMFATSPFATSMVTPNDPVVKEFVAEVTKRTGGTTAGIAGGSKEVARLMQAIYDYMCETGMRYTSDAGVPEKIGDVQTTVQTVRLPRDVILTNEGLCIELAILWASVMEHLGMPSTVVFIPGHALTVVQYGQGPDDIIPIECTAITPMAVGAKERVSFDKAVEMAYGELFPQDQSKRPPQIWVNVREYQKQGFRAPELPPIEIDKVKNILAQRERHTGGTYAQNNSDNKGGEASEGVGGANASQKNAVRPGYYRWVGAGNMVSVDVPEGWTRMENAPIPGMVFTAQDMQTSVALNVFHYPNISSVQEAMQTARQGVSRNGGKVKIASQQKKANGTVYTGTTTYRNGTTQWVGMFAPTDDGVAGIFVGAAKGLFERNQTTIEDLIAHARLGAGGNPEQGNDGDKN
jgi:transglutaminase-like putative cysteine protease